MDDSSPIEGFPVVGLSGWLCTGQKGIDARRGRSGLLETAQREASGTKHGAFHGDLG